MITIQHFTTLHNARRSQMTPPKHAEKFTLTKSKIIVPSIKEYDTRENGVPYLKHYTPPVSKQVEDTAGKKKLFKAVWDYYMGTAMKAQSSEGNYRPTYTDSRGIEHKGKRIGSPNRGMPDLTGGYNGKTYYIEQKRIGEKHLQTQIDYAKWVRSWGGVYVTARTFEDIYGICQAILNDESLERWEWLNGVTYTKKELF